MKRKIGQADIGYQLVEMFVESDYSGGQFSLCAEDSNKGHICVGLNNDWDSVLTAFVHECVEFAYTQMGLRLLPAPHYCGDLGGFTFIMNHAQFAEATGRAAKFMVDILPLLATAYKKRKKR